VRPSTRRRSLVFCAGRIYNFERWHLFATVMELYRAYGVDLTLVHVQSVLPAIYRLMQYYEVGLFLFLTFYLE
jgi:hypothetical protein